MTETGYSFYLKAFWEEQYNIVTREQYVDAQKRIGVFEPEGTLIFFGKYGISGRAIAKSDIRYSRRQMTLEQINIALSLQMKREQFNFYLELQKNDKEL